MAALPPQVKKHIDYLKKCQKDLQQKYQDHASDFTFAYRLKDSLPAELCASVSDWMDGDRVKITIQVKSFTDVLPLLERIESLADKNIAGFTFNETVDQPVWNDRLYKCDRMTVEAHLDGEGTDNCRRVITGYTQPKPQPIYAFDCQPGQLPPVEPFTADEFNDA